MTQCGHPRANPPLASEASAQNAPTDGRHSGLVITIAAAFYLIVGGYLLWSGSIWTDEVGYLARGRWYVAGTIAPYTDRDASWYMPLSFYHFGWLQSLFGGSVLTARVASFALGGLTAVGLFLLVRRLSGGPVVAAYAVLLLVASPPMLRYFTGAVPISAVAALHLASMTLVALAPRSATLQRSAALGLLMGVSLLYRQNMILCFAMLVPYYIHVVGERRLRHAVVLAATAAMVIVVAAAIFPNKMMHYAVRLPGLTGVLERIGWLSENLSTIQATTVERDLLGLSFEKIYAFNTWNNLLMPYAGHVAAAALAGLVLIVRRSHLAFWPAYYLVAMGLHHLGSVGYYSGAILMYAGYFNAAAPLALAMAMSGPGVRVPAAAAAALVIANIVAAPISSWFIYNSGEQGRWYPLTAVPGSHTPDHRAAAHLSNWLAAHVPQGPPLVILSASPVVILAAVDAELMFPVQALNLSSSHRHLIGGLDLDRKAAALKAIEAEALWTNDVMRRWIANDAALIIADDWTDTLDPESTLALRALFEPVASYAADDVAVTIFRRTGLSASSDPSSRSAQPLNLSSRACAGCEFTVAH